MILDSTFIIDLLANNEQAVRKAEQLDRTYKIKAISAVSAMEIWRGVLRFSRKDEEKKKVGELMSALQFYPFGENEALQAAHIETELIARGQMIDLEDVMIAATAMVKNQPVLTRNSKHFSRINGLTVETY